MWLTIAVFVLAFAGGVYLVAMRPCHGGHGHRHWRWSRRHDGW